MNELSNKHSYVYRRVLDPKGQFHFKEQLPRIGLIVAFVPQQSPGRIEEHRYRIRDDYQIGVSTGDASHPGHRMFVGNIALLPVFDHARDDFIEQAITDYLKRYRSIELHESRDYILQRFLHFLHFARARVKGRAV